VVEFFEDAGISGRQGPRQRPGLDRLLQPLRDELFPLSAKPFWVADATVPKPLPANGYRNEAPERRIQGAQIN
jgi:hypothetical protein